MTVPFYEKFGFARSHSIENFFIDNYDHPIFEGGVQLTDMIYLQKKYKFEVVKQKIYVGGIEYASNLCGTY